MFYTYKNCTVLLNNRSFVAANLSFDINSNLEARYFASKKYSHSYQASEAVNGTMAFSYVLTGQDYFHDLIYKENIGIEGNFGQMSFPSGHLTSYRISASPNTMARASVEIAFFDFEGQLGSGSFTPSTEKPSQDKTMLNFIDATINGTGLTDANSSVVDASFSYSMDVKPVYNLVTGTGLYNIKPDSISFGPKKLETAVTIDNLSGAMRMQGENTILGIELRDRETLSRQVYYEARGFTNVKNIQADNQSFAKNSIRVTQDAPSFLAKITGKEVDHPDNGGEGWGPTGGAPGETIDISGINFLSYPDVWIGRFELFECQYVNDNLIRFTVPEETAGADGTIYLKNGDNANASTMAFKSLSSTIQITRIR